MWNQTVEEQNSRMKNPAGELNRLVVKNLANRLSLTFYFTEIEHSKLI